MFPPLLPLCYVKPYFSFENKALMCLLDCKFKSVVYLAGLLEVEHFMGEDCTCSTVTRRVNSVPSRRCSGKSSKDSLFSSFSSASACTRVSTSFSASSSATLCPKHCWQRPVLESAKLETSNNSEHAGALCVGVSWRKREKGRKDVTGRSME